MKTFFTYLFLTVALAVSGAVGDGYYATNAAGSSSATIIFPAVPQRAIRLIDFDVTSDLASSALKQYAGIGKFNLLSSATNNSTNFVIDRVGTLASNALIVLQTGIVPYLATVWGTNITTNTVTVVTTNVTTNFAFTVALSNSITGAFNIGDRIVKTNEYFFLVATNAGGTNFVIDRLGSLTNSDIVSLEQANTNYPDTVFSTSIATNFTTNLSTNITTNVVYSVITTAQVPSAFTTNDSVFLLNQPLQTAVGAATLRRDAVALFWTDAGEPMVLQLPGTSTVGISNATAHYDFPNN